MAWGVKIVQFESGAKVKIGNTVLEALHSAIIRDYLTTVKDHNRKCDPAEKLKVFTSRTYRKWLKVCSTKFMKK